MNVEQPALPFAGKHSAQPARELHRRRRRREEPRRQDAALPAVAAEHGPATDHGAHDATGLPLATVNSIRNTLMAAGLVGSAGITHGVDGARRTLWRVQEVAP